MMWGGIALCESEWELWVGKPVITSLLYSQNSFLSICIESGG